MLISCLLIGFSGVSYAALPNRTVMQRFNAWVASALVAANITIGSTVAPVQQVLDTLNYGADMPWTPQYTYQGPTWDDDIMDRAVIHVMPDVVTIDGVDYTDIWLSTDASQKFRVNAFDLESAWNIASNSNGIYASGYGYSDGIPLYQIGNKIVSQHYGVTFPTATSQYKYANYQIGDWGVSLRTRLYAGSKQAAADASQNGEFNSYTSVSNNLPNYNGYIQVRYGSSAYRLYCVTDNGAGGELAAHFQSISNPTVSAFDFDWVSGTIPAEQLPDGTGLHFLVPSSYTDSGSGGDVYNYDIHDLITLNPNITNPNGYEFNFDPDLNPDFQLDLDTNDALGAIISAVIAAYLADLLSNGTKIEYSIDEPEPAPDPDTPDPDVPIGDQDPIWLDNLLRWIKTTIDNLGDRIHHDIDSIKEVIQDILQSIEEMADKILEDIELGPAKLFDKALDILKTLFLPLLLPIRAMMNLWHYVVEWIQSVSSPFTWIFGVMSGTSYNMVLPIYALLAGGICISIYKALGR